MEYVQKYQQIVTIILIQLKPPIIAMNAKSQNSTFEFVIHVNELLDYALKIFRTRKNCTEKSKIYESKNYFYIAVYKQKEDDQWSQKY
ncbi:unnamed protein product [Paramecium sonneborni]|uniref:Uncharacterized protein n=1 Tax=Paramecium sonneborni TaxID=65129 RepID=A0A8S1M9V4_9CILI|nr:unnamed protein product [Paramecium sonneborni]